MIEDILVLGGSSMSATRIKHDSALIIISGIIGFLGLSDTPRFATLILAVPIFWSMTKSRMAAFGVMLAYFLTVSRGLLLGAAVFLSEHHTFIQATVLYFLMSLGVSLPFSIFWSKNRRKRAFCLPVAFLVAFVLPPISLIGIVNPFLTAGTIFKGFGCLGIGITILLWVLCAVSRKITYAFLCVIVAFTVLPNDSWYISPQPDGFMAIDTSIGRLGSGSYDFADDYERIQHVFADLRKHNLKNSDAKFIVLPETIAGRVNPSGLDLWRKELSKLVNDGTTVIWGGEVPTGDGRKYDNAAIMLHNGDITITPQRIPVPYSMYRGPFAETGANLHFFSDGILELPDGRKAAIVICYEAYLTWPYLLSMRHKPDMIISMANLWWCRNTSLPTTQRNTVNLWGLLFGVPTIFATNL